MAAGISKLLIANRGEIAVRIVRAARELGIRTVVAHSSADRESLAVRLADGAVEIGPPAAAKSYLNIDAVIAAAQSAGADAIHPGYGFLAENATFADRIATAGLTFVGPSADTIRTMGDKAAARAAAQAAGVPTVPGSDGIVADLTAARAVAERIGYPVVVKAVAGGGGRGIRIAHDDAELASQLPVAQAEAQAAFGDGAVYLEAFITNAAHVEVQVMGDGQRVVHLFERDCSLQRRRQKIFEEAASPTLDEGTRQALCAAAVKLAAAVGYRGAGTLEFLYDRARGAFYFIEMNTRIQVEHPTTEMITGIDLVRTMLKVAAGDSLPFAQDDVVRRGHAIEVRINAEDPDHHFRPNVGKIEFLTWPGGPGVRVDSMLYPGYAVSPFYDSLLAKLIVWDETRDAALARLDRALGELLIEGVKTTAPLHRRLLKAADVRAGRIDTNWLERWMQTPAA